MQFIRRWAAGADSCRITWNHPEIKLRVTLYPMVHIASRSFYEYVSRDLERFEYVLHEGVQWRRASRRHLYDLVAKNLGLAAQEDALRCPETAKKVNIDMPSEEFRERLNSIPIRYRVLLIFLRPLLWLLTTVPAIKYFMLTKVVVGNREYEYNEETPLDSLIMTERDAHIAYNFARFLRSDGILHNTRYIAIVFGAGHMAAISQCLRKLGFRSATKKWIEMVRLVPENGILRVKS